MALSNAEIENIRKQMIPVEKEYIHKISLTP